MILSSVKLATMPFTYQGMRYRATSAVTSSSPPASIARSTSDRHCSSGDCSVARTSAIRSSSTMSVRPFVHTSTRSLSDEPKSLDVNRRPERPLHPDRVGEDVCEVARRRGHVREWRRRHRGRMVAADGVVACQSHQLSVAQQIGPRVADVGEEEVVARPEGRGQRGLVSVHRTGATLVDHGAVDMPVEPLGPCHDLPSNRIVDAKVPLPEVTHQMHERGNGEMTGGFAGAGAAHAISDDHRVTVLVEARGNHIVGQARQERFLMPAQSQDQIVVLVHRS